VLVGGWRLASSRGPAVGPSNQDKPETQIIYQCGLSGEENFEMLSPAGIGLGRCRMQQSGFGQQEQGILEAGILL